MPQLKSKQNFAKEDEEAEKRGRNLLKLKEMANKEHPMPVKCSIHASKTNSLETKVRLLMWFLRNFEFFRDNADTQ